MKTVHVKELNFILRSEAFVHWDGQLRASHLILGVELVYSTWQSFKQALLVDSPLLSYIDIRYANFLPPKLTTGEVREFGKHYTCSDELAPLRDKFTERVSRCLRELAHEAIKKEALVQEPAQLENPVEPEAPIVEAKHLALEATNLSATDTLLGEDMVTRKVMTIYRFLPGTRHATQPPPSPSRSQVPPPPQAG